MKTDSLTLSLYAAGPFNKEGYIEVIATRTSPARGDLVVKIGGKTIFERLPVDLNASDALFSVANKHAIMHAAIAAQPVTEGQKLFLNKFKSDMLDVTTDMYGVDGTEYCPRESDCLENL
jgi:hypothetical protein